MRFLVDAQLPPALARWLQGQGHEAEHIFDRLPPASTDTSVWQEALRLGAVIVSKDEDFRQRSLHTHDGPPILWLRVGNTSNRALQEWFTSLWPNIITALERGERLVEVV